METKICEICGNLFNTNRPTKRTCSEECHKKRIANLKKEEYYKNIEDSRAKSKQNVHKYTMLMKEKFFEHYGAECAICHEKNKDLLTIDHINNDGAEHRKKVGDNTYCVIKDLERRNWPVGEVQTLCYNCNNKKKMIQQTYDGSSAASILRAKAIEVLGGCCRCGINDNQMLEIRPKNGNIKYYQAIYKSRNSMLKAIIDDEKVREQFEVLCVNCHREIQYTGFRTFSKNKYVTVKVK